MTALQLEMLAGAAIALGVLMVARAPAPSTPDLGFRVQGNPGMTSSTAFGWVTDNRRHGVRNPWVGTVREIHAAALEGRRGKPGGKAPRDVLRSSGVATRLLPKVESHLT